VAGQIKTQLSPTQALSLNQEVRLMLKSRDLLEKRNDAIEAALHTLLVSPEVFVCNLIGEGVLTRIER
jgi:hypothetical protein